VNEDSSHIPTGEVSLVTSQEDAINQDQGHLAEVLQGWHRAKEAASRNNRNLLQYGAMIAGALGIEAGSSGVIAVASSLGTLPWWGPVQFMGTTLIMIGIAVVGAVLALRAYQQRSEAEKAVEQYAIQLIALRPDRFLPDADTLLGSQT
jgi:hypothetical protein